ncbi:hypothetical protein [Noviherbaspirillum sedimenti]|uniref:Uncharacterized protein n=1 Tax=Noviherbaspirillum sedimenti TaxID=2320865 RepID=A0A3A3G6R5_9BURK|nr:hypothetical protein [Noviherbaspirillum sedimenti]RJG04108.1 hypothetical protein D3878_23040 [Noviherbaspirillum sedimenti]
METTRIHEIPVAPVKERRRMSQAGLLDSAIRMVAQLTTSNDLHTRTIANRAMADLQKMRHEMPKRRQFDSTARHR